MSYDFSLNFSETMFKRLWWQGYKGRFVAFRWATQTSIDSYNTSEWLAWKYGKSLRNYVENYLKREMPNYPINIAAHSMGNIVTGSALARGMTVNTYMLMQAAIPSGCYNDTVNNYLPFTEAEQERHATPDTTADNGYRMYLSSYAANVGKIVSFFNVNDFALAKGSTFPIGNTNWEQNEIAWKPDRPFVGKEYDYYPATHQSVLLQSPEVGTIIRTVDDPDEVKAFVARPRSKALGAEPNSAIVFGEAGAVDLHLLCGFDSDETDHSGQFNRGIQALHPFYQRMLDELAQ